MTDKTIIYIPNKEEKDMIVIKCKEIADILKGLKSVQVAMILKIFTDSLEKHNGMTAKMVAYKKKGDDLYGRL